MSSSRNKRKRNDGDPTAAAATTTAPSRRRSREARSSGAEPTMVDSAASKNEGASNSNIATTGSTTPAVVASTSTVTTDTIGESSASGNPSGTATSPQHTQATSTAAATKEAARETNEEKKRESEPNAVSPPPPGTGNTSTTAPAMTGSSDTVQRAPTPQNLADAATSSAAQPPSGTTAVPPPSASATDSIKKNGPANVNNGDSRENKLQAMITHRKILLERVKSGRSAARSRIVDVARREAQSASKTKQLIAASGGDPSKGNTAGLSEKARDEAEVAAFKNLSKSALQAAKKQRAENIADGGAPGEKRSSVSLRKGASVGKNMKAALSSLIPGGAVSSAVPLAAASSAAQPLHNVGATAGDQTAALLPAQRTGVPRIPGQLPLPTKKQKSASGQIQQQQQAATKQPRAPGAMVVDSMPKVARTNSQKNLKTASNATMVRGISSSALAASSLPLHAGLSAPGLPSNRLVGPPPVICPEAQVLRERKQAIRSKLLEHLKEQQTRMTRAEDSASQSTTTEDSSKSLAAASALAMPLSLKSGPEQPSHLPRRRKTHWDNLLGEMKWMATDFLEERKWKVSAARTLGSALQASGTKAMKHRIEETATTSSAASSITPMEVDTETGPPKHDTDSESKKTKKAPAKSTTSKKAASAAEQKPAKLSDSGLSGLYSKPTTDDTNSSRKVARIISNMAHELGSATVEASALSNSDEPYKQALERHIATRKGIEQDENDGTTVATTSPGESSKDEDKMNVDTEGSAAESDDANAKTGDGSKDKAGSYQRISKAVDALFENSPNNKNSRKGSKRGKASSSVKGDGGNVSLTSWQQETMDFLEKKWGNSNGPGTVLAGPRASGKTVAVCSLLWKRRTSGPQLLLCSPYRVMNWIHEMRRFEGLRIRSFGFSGGISSPISDDNQAVAFEPREVVICEYSSLHRLQHRDFATFETLVIDCRYPCGFQGSRRPSDFDGKVLEHSTNITSIVPADLINESWWGHLIKLTAKSPSNRLLVENPLQASCFTTAPEKTEMQRVELVALRAAFLLGAQIFVSPSSSVKKRILTWARRKTKDSVEPTGNKIKAVQDFLIELVQPFYCPEKGGDNLLEAVSHAAGKRFDIETRPCSLSQTERREYDKSCVALRGALSFDSSKFPSCKHLRDRSMKTISEALLRLRRQCVHTDLSSILTSAPMLSRLCAYDVLTSAGTADNRMICRKVNDSPSQTDTDLASRILKGSAKFRELVSILRNECYYNVEGHETFLDEFLQPEKGKRGKAKPVIDAKAAKTRKKVVILAMLPEVQIILSVLLNCIGIRHELLLCPSKSFSSQTTNVMLSHPERRTSASTLAWVECQQALARFNTPTAPSSTFSTDLIVASPDIIAGDHGGIGIDMADTIISVDEDWSGRHELIMRSLIADLIPSNLRAKDNGCEFIRLVCEKTCEENFLSIESKDTPSQSVEQSHAEAWPWRIDAYGRFDLFDKSVDRDSSKQGSWPLRKQDEEIFAFPASNVLRFRNQRLAEVLGIEDGLPPLLIDGSPVLFLPNSDGKKTKSDSSTANSYDMDLVVNIMKAEDHTHSLCKEAGVESSAPASLPNNVMTRLDLGAIAIRLYMEHFGGKSRLSKQLLSSSNQVVSAGESSSSARAVSSELNDTVDTNYHVGDAVEFASSLLFYIPPAEDVNGQEKQGELRISADGEWGNASNAVLPVETLARSRDVPRRVNKYVDAYNLFLDKNIRDGQQGSEALVYFPPLFPGLQICASRSHQDIEALRARSASDGTAKRPRDTSADPAAKRLKIDDPLAPADFNPSPSTAHSVAGAIVPPAVPALISVDESSHGSDATVLLDLDEDFGLIGVGAIPLGKDSAAASSSTIVEVAGNAADPDGAALQNWFDGVAPCDIEELDSFRFSPPNGLSLDSMILFVGRKPRQRLPLAAGNPAYRPPATLQNALPGPGNGVAILDINGTGTSAKKSKKKAHANLAVMAPGSHSTSQLPLNVQIAKAKEMYRSRILSFLSARQKALGMTLFESPTYCVAAVRLRHRLSDRLSGQSRAFYPSAKNDQTKWTSIVKRLKTSDSATGEDARALAESQLSALHRSLSGPSRVDFGPFHGGFLPVVSGLTGISPPRSRIGISLPMGVKVPSVLQQQHLQHTWSDVDDQRLRECTARYGMNWILVARVLTGFDDVVIASAVDRTTVDANISPFRFRKQRSARGCRDRWQALVRNDLTLAKGARKNEQGTRENKSLNATIVSAEASSATRLVERKADQSSSTSFLFPSASLQAQKTSPSTEKSAKATILESSEMDVDDVEGTETAGKPVADSARKMDVDKPRKKKYGSMMAARSKVQVIPMTIPGVPPGSQASFVASHPSHPQSVQSSVAAAWTNGRTEMWPLQFLDVAEKQRAATAAASSPSLSGGSRGSSRARAPGGVPSRSHNPAGQPYASPTRKTPPYAYHPQVAPNSHVPPSRSPHAQQRMAPSPAIRVAHPAAAHPRVPTHAQAAHPGHPTGPPPNYTPVHSQRSAAPPSSSLPPSASPAKKPAPKPA